MSYRFEQNYRVRYDECNIYGWLTPVAVLRYLQDIAVLDAVQIQLHGSGNWVAHRTIVDFYHTVPVDALVQVATYPLDFSKVTALRGYDLWATLPGQTEPQLVTKARTLWVYLDSRGRPTRITPEMTALWIPPGTTLPPPPAEKSWPVFPAPAPFTTTTPVRFSDLDVLGHMNNAAYVELLDDVTWQIFAQHDLLPLQSECYPTPSHYDIEYVALAKAGDLLQVQTWFEPDHCLVPQVGQNFERWQRILSDNNLIVRSRSQWQWQPFEKQS